MTIEENNPTNQLDDYFGEMMGDSAESAANEGEAVGMSDEAEGEILEVAAESAKAEDACEEPVELQAEQSERVTNQAEGDAAVEVEGSQTEVTLTLDAAVDMGTIAKLHEKIALLPWDELEKIILDAEDLDEIDFVGVQLFCSLKKSCDTREISMEWENIPIPLFQATEELNLSKAIGM